MKSLFYSVFLAVIASTSSCTPTLSGLQVSESFTHDLISKEGMVIAGVVKADGPWDRNKNNMFSGMLANSIMNERKEFKVSPIGSFISAVGEDNASKIWHTYKTIGMLNKKELEMVAKKLPNKRFLILAKMDSDVVSESTSYQEPREDVDSKGNKTYVRGRTIARSSRDLSYTINIFDLKKLDSAFSGSMSNSASESKEYLDEEKSNSLLSGIADVIRASKGSENQKAQTEFKAPPPPGYDYITKYIFSGFAKNFPEKD